MKLIFIGFGLLITGFLSSFLMLIHLLESTFVLNFLAYFSSLSGLILGILGIVRHRHSKV